jgi:hypothetical protein
MADTITAFTTFQPNTQIKSSEVNTNFSNFRGDIVPINTDTATASDNTHDLGQPDHRFNICYNTINLFGPGATAGSWRFQIDTTTTTFVVQRYSSTTWVTKFSFGE